MIFIDTGAFVARYLQRDQHYAAAVAHWQELRASRLPCITSNFVLDEAITLLGRRAGNQFAAHCAQLLYGSAALTILRPLGGDETAAVQLFEKYADQNVSFTDCVSFVLMTKFAIKTAFTFDRHFSLAGFEVVP